MEACGLIRAMKTQLAQNVRERLAIISDDITKMDGFFKSPDDITKIVGPLQASLLPSYTTFENQSPTSKCNSPLHNYTSTAQHIDYFIWQVPNTAQPT